MRTTTVKALRELARAGTHDALKQAVIAGARGAAKVKVLSVAMAAELDVQLPLETLLALSTRAQDQDEAETLGRALALHHDDAALDAMLDQLARISNKQFWESNAAIGFALRLNPNPRATDALLAIVQDPAMDADHAERARWALRGRRPRDPRVAAAGRAIGGEDGDLLRLGHAEPDEVVDLVDRVIAGTLKGVAFTQRADAVAAWLSSLVSRALDGDVEARARLLEVAKSKKSLSGFHNVFKHDVFSPPLVALVENGDRELAEAAYELYGWLPIERTGRLALVQAARARLARGEEPSRYLEEILDAHTPPPDEDLFTWALKAHDADSIRAALSAGANANDVLEAGARPLHLLVESWRAHEIGDVIEAVKLLIEAGADPRAAVTEASDIDYDDYDGEDYDEDDYTPRFQVGDTPALIVMRQRFVVGRSAADAVITALGEDPREVLLALL